MNSLCVFGLIQPRPASVLEWHDVLMSSRLPTWLRRRGKPRTNRMSHPIGLASHRHCIGIVSHRHNASQRHYVASHRILDIMLHRIAAQCIASASHRHRIAPSQCIASTLCRIASHHRHYVASHRIDIMSHRIALHLIDIDLIRSFRCNAT